MNFAIQLFELKDLNFVIFDYNISFLNYLSCSKKDIAEVLRNKAMNNNKKIKN